MASTNSNGGNTAAEEEMLSSAVRNDVQAAIISTNSAPEVTTNGASTSAPIFTPPVTVNEIDGRPPQTAAASNSYLRARPMSNEGASKKVSGMFGRWSSQMEQGMKKLSLNLGLENAHQVQRNPIFFFFGDSLTERGSNIDKADGIGWIARLAHIYGNRVDLLNRGFSGYNTRWALRVFPRLFHAVNTDCIQIVTLWFGTNDSIVEGQPQHVPVDEYRHNLAKLILYIREQGNMKITPVLITPPPIDDEGANRDAEKEGRPLNTRTYAAVKKYVAACLELARQTKVPCINLHQVMESQPNFERFFNDGFHFNSQGQEFVAKTILTAIRRTFRQFDPDTLDRVFPHWSEIDADNPGKALGSSELV